MYVGASSEEYLQYHDEEWGRPSKDDRYILEMITLEGFQAGLTWSLILSRRAEYKRAFANFEGDVLGSFTDQHVQRIMDDPTLRIVKNRGKINAAVANAQAAALVRQEFGSLAAYVWSFVQGKPQINTWQKLSQVPPKTELSESMSKDMKKRGFRYVGPTTCYSLMQAIGMVNDHVVSCPRHGVCCREAELFSV